MAWSFEDVVGVSVKYTPSSNGVDGFFTGSYGCCSDMVLILLFADGFCRFNDAGRRCGCTEVGEGCCKNTIRYFHCTRICHTLYKEYP